MLRGLRPRSYLTRPQLSWGVRRMPMTTKTRQSHLPWVARLIALAMGIALAVAGILVASNFEEILFGTPLIFLGGLGVAFAVKGRLPSRPGTLSPRGAPPNER